MNIPKQPSIPPMPQKDEEFYGDCISRQEVIKVIDRRTIETPDGLCLDDDITCILEDVPSVQPKQRTGHWVQISKEKYVQHAMSYYKCDKCNGQSIGQTAFCPNCGAKMQ